MKIAALCPILLALLASSGNAFAAGPGPGPDHVYVYGSPNRNFQCEVFIAYFSTEDSSIFYADRCVETGQDWNNWPQFQPQQIRVSMDFAPRKAALPVQPRIAQNCLYVAHALNQDRTTSTVIDCRITGAKPVALGTGR